MAFRWAVVIVMAMIASPAIGQDDVAKSAKAVLDAFHSKDPRPTERKLHVVYFTPSDKEPADDWQLRVQRTMEHIREFYAREMGRHGFAARGVPLDIGKDGKLVVHLVRGKLPFAGYSMQSGRAIREEARPVLADKGIKIDQETVLFFCNLTVADDVSVRHNSPYYAGGTARGGTAWLCDSKYIDPAHLAKREPFLRDGQYGKVSLGRYNSIFVGGTAHELGHALGLPHNRENAVDRPRGHSLMGNGNMTYGQELRGEGKGSFLPIADALRLASHPFFSGSEKDLRTPVKAAFHDWSFTPGDKDFIVKGRVESSLPCYAVVAYLDPDGGSDYDAHTAVAVVQADGTFTLPCRDLVPNRRARINLVACMANGSTLHKGFAYTVSKEGRPNLDEIRLSLLAKPVLDAWRTGDRKRYDAAVAKVTAGLDEFDGLVLTFKQLGDRLGPPPYASPAVIPESIDSLPLTDASAVRSKVGWLKPTVDHVPSEEFFFLVNGQRFDRGLYAHAPAVHEYALDAKWRRFHGSVGLQDNNPGTVVFVIKGDGKELWRSPKVAPNRTTPFDVDVQNVRRLELVTEDAGDGNGADWGLWLHPGLSR